MTVKVAFLMLDGAQLLDFAGPHDVLTAANQALNLGGKSDGYKITVFGENPLVLIGGGQNVVVGHAETLAASSRRFDTVIVVGGQNLTAPISKQALDWIRSASKKARRTVSICSGAFLLAAAGLLEHRTAATHWMFCQELQRRYPNIAVNGDSLWVRDGNIYTSAGVTSGIDLTLALVEEDFGAKIAMKVARGLVVYFRRPGSQAQFSQLLQQQQSGTKEFKELLPWIMENLHKDLSVEILAHECSMSPRHFARQFAIAFATTPAKWVARLRLEAAKTMLSETDEAIEQIARRCGFNTSDVFRKAFMRSFDLTPFEYRRIWNSDRTASALELNGHR